jgi:hypothetical protein
MTKTNLTERRIYGPEHRDFWGSGPWDSEPDEIEWTDSETGYRCLMCRNDLGAWCGYVAVGPEHPAHGLRTESDVGDELFCHWGITWSGPDLKADPLSGTLDWLFGFDCAHAYDLVPGLKAMFPHPSVLTNYVQTAVGEHGEMLRGILDFIEKIEEHTESSSSAYKRPETIYRDVAYVEHQIENVLAQLVVYATLKKTSDCA